MLLKINAAPLPDVIFSRVEKGRPGERARIVRKRKTECITQ